MPAFSFSRISFFKSIASSACESAMVWFWHTRQRNCSSSATARFSSAGLGSAGTASLASTEPARTSPNSSANSLRISIQLLHQRQDFVTHDLRGNGTDALVADHAGLIDNIRFGNTINTEIDADTAVMVIPDCPVRIAEARQIADTVGPLVLVVEPDHRHHTAARECQDRAVLFAAGNAPGGPHIEQPHLAQHILFRNRLVRMLQFRQFERRRRLVYQRRRHLARIQSQTNAE